MNNDETFNDAVTIVRNTLSPDSAKILQFSIDKNGGESAPLNNAGFGVAMRNLLAEHGIIWEEVVLYSVWFAILREAIQSFLE